MKLSLIAVLGTAALAQHANAQQVQFRSMLPDSNPKVPSTISNPSTLPPSPVGGSDSCATAEVVPPVGGTIAYTNAGSTTGPEGQLITFGGECGQGAAEYGNTQTAIPLDVWFSWTAPTTGRVRLSTCGQTADNKIAVYDVPCASIAATAVACNDDYHFAVSGLGDAAVLFTATAATTYLIQIGNSSFTPTATVSGTFDIGYVDLVTNGVWDNGNMDNALGFTAAGQGVMFMNAFKTPPGVVTVPSAQVSWFTGAVPANTPVQISIYNDPNQDQNPADAVLLDTVSSTIVTPTTNVWTTFPFNFAVPVSGYYFIAVTEIDVSGGDFPAAICGETCSQHVNSCWLGTTAAGNYPIGTIGGPIGAVPFRLGAQCNFGTTNRHSVWSIRADQVIAPTDTPFTVYCAGDGTDTACPCTNPGVAGRGCQNTVGSGGAQLSSTGIASVSADTLVMHGAFAVQFGPGLYYEGNARPAAVAPFGIPFGNGLRCAAGATNRLEIRFADGTGASNTTVSLQAFGAALSGTTYHYQLWYRDTGNVGSCTPGAGFNLSNAISLTWAP